MVLGLCPGQFDFQTITRRFFKKQTTEVSFLTYILKSSDIVVERKKKQIVALHHTSLPPSSLTLDSPGKVNFKLFFLLFFVQHYLQSGAKTNLRQKSVKPTPRLLNIGSNNIEVEQYWGQKILGPWTEHKFHSPRFYSARDAFVIERMQ